MNSDKLLFFVTISWGCNEYNLFKRKFGIWLQEKDVYRKCFYNWALLNTQKITNSHAHRKIFSKNIKIAQFCLHLSFCYLISACYKYISLKWNVWMSLFKCWIYTTVQFVYSLVVAQKWQKCQISSSLLNFPIILIACRKETHCWIKSFLIHI